MLQPKRTKFRKQHKGRIHGEAKGGFNLNFGSYALKATEPERVETIEIDMCPSGTQMQRLLKIEFFKQRRDIEGTMTTNLVGLKARFPKGRGKHLIRVVAPDAAAPSTAAASGRSGGARPGARAAAAVALLTAIAVLMRQARRG